MSTAVLTLDLGTGACKGAIHAANGSLLVEASQGYPTERPAPLWVEQDADRWWEAAVAVCRGLLERVPAAAIAGVGFSGQVPTMVLVDADGRALAPAITWQDRRAGAEADWLREHVGAPQLGTWLGIDLPVDAAYPPARLLWMRRHQADLLARAGRVLMTKEFVLAQLTGAMYSDAWSARGLVNRHTGVAPEAYYAALDVPSGLAPAIRAPYAVAGIVHRAAAEATGLRAGTPVVTGWSDALCGMAGTGALQADGVSFDLTGTSEIVGCSGKEPSAGVLHIPASVTGGVAVLYGPTQSSGDSLTWFAGWMGADVDATVAAAAAVPAGTGGTLFLPYLQGGRAPLWNAAARGALVGMRRHYGPGYGARAVLEGVAMSVRHVLETCGAPLGTGAALRVAGGSSRLDFWNQIRADVTGMTVEATAQPNATLLGAAMLAATGTGLYRTMREAAAMARVRQAFTPEADQMACYDALYGQYRALYEALSPVFAELAQFDA